MLSLVSWCKTLILVIRARSLSCACTVQAACSCSLYVYTTISMGITAITSPAILSEVRGYQTGAWRGLTIAMRGPWVSCHGLLLVGLWTFFIGVVAVMMVMKVVGHRRRHTACIVWRGARCCRGRRRWRRRRRRRRRWVMTVGWRHAVTVAVEERRPEVEFCF